MSGHPGFHGQGLVLLGHDRELSPIQAGQQPPLFGLGGGPPLYPFAGHGGMLAQGGGLVYRRRKRTASLTTDTIRE